MKANNLFYKSIFLCGFMFINILVVAQEDIYQLSKEKLVSKQGTVSFILCTDKSYKNGYSKQEKFSQPLMQIPGLATCSLERDYSGVNITMQWDNVGTHTGYYILLTELPGAQKYHILFTWDSEKGLSDGYFNGIPFRMENSRYYEPWEVYGVGTQFNIPKGPNSVTDVVLLNRYLSENEAIALVPKELKGQNSFILGQRKFPPPIDISSRKGQLLFTSKMDNEESIKEWVFEGPAIIDFADSSMIMRSQIPNPPDGSTGHFNLWCPEDFPSNIIVEWEFKPLSNKGVCHLFFAATGQHGEDIFDPELPIRDGHFQQYINDVINNYFFIYFSNIRIMRTSNLATTWLEKSSEQSVLALGQIGITPGIKEFHKVCMVKDGAHMQLIINGKVCLDFTDPDNERWGSVLNGGKISFRQMAVTMAAYKNFNVWELL